MSQLDTRVLITGSSGFIGGRLAERMECDGWEVIGIGRRPLDRRGYVSHDLKVPLPQALDGPYRAVVHAAARSNPWGTPREFEDDNVVATRNVIDFCCRQGHPHLIFVSSSSVYYRQEHQFGITEETPLPSVHVNEYASTKRRAEELIHNYSGPWTILRPRAVFGPGDTVLLPRIIRAAQAGRLPLLESPDGPVVGDLIYIDNLLDAIVAAASHDIQGTFNLTNNQPVPILDFLFRVFDGLDIPRPQRRISARTAMFVAGALEWFHRLFLPRREPVITRFGVHVFRYSKTFDIRKSKQSFGLPRVSLDEGLQRTVAWFRNSFHEKAGP